MLNYICSGRGNINILMDGKMHSISPEHLNYEKIVKALRAKDECALQGLVDVAQGIRDYLGGVDVKVIDGEVLYRGKPVYGYLVDKILLQCRLGYGFEPMCAFLENLMDNPEPDSVTQLYPFLEACGLVLTDDGCFLAYKYVSFDGKDYWAMHPNTDGTHNRNNPGDVVKMPREKVLHDPNNACGPGLHAGTPAYVAGQQHVVIVKVNPKHAVSVPHNENAGKLRSCQYQVIQVLSKGETLPEPVYSHRTDKSGLGPSKYAPAPGRFDNATASHWGN